MIASGNEVDRFQRRLSASLPDSRSAPITHQLKLIIFDLDGTLIDSLPDLMDATNYLRGVYGFGQLDAEEVRRLIGKGARNLVERALPGAPSELVDEALDLFLAFNMAHIVDKTQPYPGVAETLEQLAQRGYAQCVLSNKNVALCREVLTRLDLGDYFPAVYGADSFPSRKPSPEPVLALLKEYRLEPRECVIVGDSINDMAAGQGAGILTIGCSYGYGEPAELAGADFQVPDFPSLLSLPILTKKVI